MADLSVGAEKKLPHAKTPPQLEIREHASCKLTGLILANYAHRLYHGTGDKTFHIRAARNGAVHSMDDELISVNIQRFTKAVK